MNRKERSQHSSGIEGISQRVLRLSVLQEVRTKGFTVEQNPRDSQQLSPARDH